ncbi:MAG: SOS response-associated peptidase [Hyphomicrobiales bacterium]|nr:SOS response-associated peptidase [Hyphomicrobiales bacterium]
MCGRYAITLPPEAVRSYFDYVEQPNFPPRYNIAPTQPVPVVLARRDGDGAVRRHFQLLRWGLLPGFVKEIAKFPLIINARSESCAEKPSFRNALRRRRCLFIMDGYYEWQAAPAAKMPKQPWLFQRPDRGVFAVAGLHEYLVTADGSELETACLLTTAANAQVRPVHDRMPVVIAPPDFDTWLDLDETRFETALPLLRPAADDYFVATRIGPAINNARHEGAVLQTPLKSPAIA